MGIVVNKLIEDKESLERQNQKLPNQLSIASSLASSFGVPSQNLDNYTLTSLGTANTAKSAIVAIGGNTGLSTTRYGASTSNISTQYGSIVVGTGTATASSLGIAGLGTAIIAYGTVNGDIIRAWNYPNVTNAVYTAENPFDGESWVTITSGNAGIGASTRVFQSSGSSLGVVFDITGPSVDVSTQVTAYNNTITNLTNYATLATQTKKPKTDYQFQSWSLGRQLQENQDSLAEINTALGVSTNPAYGGPY